ncbi:MAG: LytTR family DNA-binding domain-containing protein [Oscillospiraceae bacterium]
MKITINENSNLTDTEIIINCKCTDENVLKIIASLRAYDHKLTGTKDNKTFIIDSDNVLYCDTVDKKTFIYTQTEVFETPLKLYELEEKLSSSDFFRASKSTIINLAKIKSLMPDFGGRLEVTLENDEKLNISRQYAPYMKQKLSL